MFREISPMHLGLSLLAFVILFGYKKLPDATRSPGRSMRIFKSEVEGLHDDAPQAESTAVSVIAASAVPTQLAAVPSSEKTSPDGDPVGSCR
jgi:sec-independent protein translocase protein TatA